MPVVTAIPAGMSTGESVTEFIDTVGTTLTAFTYPITQEKLRISNESSNGTIQVTVNSAQITLLPTEYKEFYGSIDSFSIVSTSGAQSFRAVATDYKNTQLSQDSTGATKFTMTTLLNKELDSIDVGKMSKGGATTAHNAISATTTSAEIPCVGYNSVIVHISGITGTWDVSVQNATVSGGTFVDAYDDRAVQMKAAGVTSARSIMYRGVLDYVKIVATNVAAGSVTVKVVPINV